MIKILHTADIHLDSPLKSLAFKDESLQKNVQVATRNVLQKIISLAICENVAAVLLAGDLFDSAQRSAQTSAFLLTQLQKLAQYNIPVYYIKGNHDAENPLINNFEFPENVKVFSPEGETYRLPQTLNDGKPIYIHGVSFNNKTSPNLLDKFPAAQPHAYNIGLLHTSLNGSIEKDAYAPCSANALAAVGYDYWALGHIHKRSTQYIDKSAIVMPGIPQGRDIGETGQKSVTLLKIFDDGTTKLEEQHTSDIIFINESLSLNHVESEQSFQNLLSEKINNISKVNNENNIILRLTLTGETSLYWQIMRDMDLWQKVIEEQALVTNHIWLEKLKLKIDKKTDPYAYNLVTEEDVLPIAELQNTMETLTHQDSFKNMCLNEIKSLIHLLPEEIRKKNAKTHEEQKQWESSWRDNTLRISKENIAALLTIKNTEQGGG